MAAEVPSAKGVLLVEDDAAIVKSLRRIFTVRWHTVDVPTAAAAREHLRRAPPLAGAVIDVGLPDGSGLDVLAEARQRQPGIEVIVVTGELAPDIVNRATSLGALYVVKPKVWDCVEDFARRLLLKEVVSAEPARRYLAAYATRQGLSIRETEILALAVEGVGMTSMAERMGVSGNTLKTQVRTLRRKCGNAHLGAIELELRDAIRRQSLD